MLHRKLFNLIIENVDFEKLRIDKTTKFSIGINDIEITINKNHIHIQLNGICTGGIFDFLNYGDYVIKIGDLIDTVLFFYLQDRDTRHRTEKEILEFWND